MSIFTKPWLDLSVNTFFPITYIMNPANHSFSNLKDDFSNKRNGKFSEAVCE